MDLEQMKAFIADVEQRLKAEGFSTVSEMVGAYQSAIADRDKAVTARDKFNAANDEAQKIIRSRGGEMGTLKQEIAQLKEQLAAAQGTKPQASETHTPPAVKPLEEQLKELESSLTDAQWKAADALLERMTDAEALTFTQSKKDRLEFLTGLKNDPAMQVVERPKSFRASTNKPADTPSGENAYEQMVKRIRGVRPGPSGAPAAVRTGNPAQAGQRPVAGWLK
jgi:DNA repair exonuclease SbcCD ATPase subunit